MPLTINYSRQSPNYFSSNYPIKAIVLHGTAGPFQASIDWLCNPMSNASANFIINTDGTVYCLVDPAKNKRAWANGILQQPDMTLGWLKDCVNNGINPNLCTVSIEHVATSQDMIAHNQAAFTQAQRAASLALSDKLCRDFGIPRTRDYVVGHYQIQAVDRANCPGIIDIDRYVGDLKAMEFNPNPNNYAVGQGMIDKLNAIQQSAMTPEIYTSGDSSILLATGGYTLLAAKVGGGPAWEVRAVKGV